ncbi:MAG TPA: Na+/H+ antiporter NhaC family protein [Thermoanaerobaculia bacterium]|nr:Na+/H+ antiporter NhaC family protein [Thermoanaerobaculia bacterium]
MTDHREGPSGRARPRTVAAFGLSLLTFAFLGFGEPAGTPAALWPSVLAITLAFVTRDIYVSLLAGAFAGTLLLAGGNPLSAFLALFERHLLAALASPWNLSVLVFTLMMGGFVELLDRGGGMVALATRALGRVAGGERGRRRAGLVVYGLGWLFFVDGLANSMLLGKAMRSVADRARMSREKLAFLVDSTSSPIAGLALVSTWVAYELSVIRDGFAATPGLAEIAAPSPFLVLVWSLPHRYYNLFMLWVVFLVVWLGRDLGPMLGAERRVAAETRPSAATAADPAPSREAGRAWRALVPLAVLVLGVIVGLFGQGGGFGRPLTLDSAVEALGAADAALVFVWATAFASLLALLVWRPVRGEARGATSYLRGMEGMFLPALILVFAWTLNSVIQELGAARYLVGLLGDSMPAAILPVSVFVLSAAVSFSTGTSWGTMALVMPLVIPLAAAVAGLEHVADLDGAVVATVGSVLAGAVFGDHCSPISDTTLVSALASDCDAMEHVRTQVPYALGAAAIAALLGYLPAGLGIPPWPLLLAGGAVCVAWIRFAGRPLEG